MNQLLYSPANEMSRGFETLFTVSCNKDPVGQADEVKKPTWVENPLWIGPNKFKLPHRTWYVHMNPFLDGVLDVM